MAKKKGKKVDEGRIVGGAILLIIAAYIIISQTDLSARFVGGGILAVLALALLITGFTKK